jgi:S1-C subfamily serine protease
MRTFLARSRERKELSMSTQLDASPLGAISDALAALVGTVAPHVVAVHSHRARSSGFVWKPGLIVTADESLAEEGDITVTRPGGNALPATLAGRDPTTDIALLRAEGLDLAPVTLGTGRATAGTLAVAVGAGSDGPIAALGLVAAAGPAWRSMRGGEIDQRIELDLSLRRSAEGALALDASGGVLGMAVFGSRRRVLVIPSQTITHAAARLETHGRVARGYLGLGLQQVRLDGGAGLGAIAMNVAPDGPGSKAGLRQGDVIVAWDGQPLQSVHALLRSLGPNSVGHTILLALRRSGEPVETRLTIAERPQE